MSIKKADMLEDDYTEENTRIDLWNGDIRRKFLTEELYKCEEYLRSNESSSRKYALRISFCTGR